MKPKTYIKDVTFDFDKSKTKCGPHIAYTLPDQGGSASGLGNEKAFLFKADEDSVEITEDVVKTFSEIGIDIKQEINKDLNLTNNKMQLLSHAVMSKFKTECCDWMWVCDFNEDDVYFSSYDGLFKVGYSVAENGDVLLDDKASPVIRLDMFMEVEGDLKVSSDAIQSLQERDITSLNKCLDTKEFVENISSVINKSSDELPLSEDNKPHSNTSTEVIKNKEKEDLTLDIQEILKSEDFQNFISQREEEVKKSVEASYQEKLDALEKANKAAEQELEKSRKERLDRIEKGFAKGVSTLSFIEESQQEAIVKGFVENHDNTFVVELFKMLETAQAELEKTKEEFALTETGIDKALKEDVEEDTGLTDLEKALEEKYGEQSFL